MTITVLCPSCETSFPVDPAKVPPEGVRAQCSVCPEIFDVDSPSVATLEAEPAPESTADAFESADPLDAGEVDLPPLEGSFEGAEPTITDDAPTEGDLASPDTEDYAAEDVSIDAGPSDTAEVAVEAVEVDIEPAVEAADLDEPAEEAADLDEPAEEADSPGPIRFGRRSPEDKAKSLARSLVSDLIAYNPEKHKEALAAGTLQEIFGDEIEKSLKEYQEQVEPDVMSQGTFFNDALNSILAEGQSVFSVDG